MESRYTKIYMPCFDIEGTAWRLCEELSGQNGPKAAMKRMAKFELDRDTKSRLRLVWSGVQVRKRIGLKPVAYGTTAPSRTSRRSWTCARSRRCASSSARTRCAENVLRGGGAARDEDAPRAVCSI